MLSAMRQMFEREIKDKSKHIKDSKEGATKGGGVDSLLMLHSLQAFKYMAVG